MLNVFSDADFVDWITVDEECYYFATEENIYIKFENQTEEQANEIEQVMGYKAVKVNVPRTWAEALRDPKWGPAARLEWNQLTSTKAIVEANSQLARQQIEEKSADLCILFPIYEEKVKDGKTVYKVRLVANGRTHTQKENIYAGTPSKEELLTLLQMIASRAWRFVHIDEIRAFLNARNQSSKKVYTKFQGSHDWYEIVGALYGLRSSPRDYQEEVERRLKDLGYKRLCMCRCIYLKESTAGKVLIYAYVDDFIITCSTERLLDEEISIIRMVSSTTVPKEDPEIVLGMELKRDRERRTISLTMESKISELCHKYEIHKTIKKIRKTPMPANGFRITESDYKDLDAKHQEQLNLSEIKEYMNIIGSLIWISSVRFDIVLSTSYLSWFTKNPLRHHLYMAICVLEYLYVTRTLPLVLGGHIETKLIGYSDAALGKGPKGRSIIGTFVSANPTAGALICKTTTTKVVHSSSFESELEGCIKAEKSLCTIRNIYLEINEEIDRVSTLYSDNESMINFVKSEYSGTNVKHMDLKMWYFREKLSLGNLHLVFMPGEVIPTDNLTKIGTGEKHEKFIFRIMGLGLLHLPDDFKLDIYFVSE